MSCSINLIFNESIEFSLFLVYSFLGARPEAGRSKVDVRLGVEARSEMGACSEVEEGSWLVDAAGFSLNLGDNDFDRARFGSHASASSSPSSISPGPKR